MSCHNLPHNDQYSTTKIDTVSPRKNCKLTNSGNETEESTLSSDKENSSSSEESEIIDHIRNLKYKGIAPGKVRSGQPQEATRTDKKVQESKEDEVVFERDVAPKKETNVIAETERTQLRGTRVVKSITLSENDKDHRSANKTIKLIRDNQYSGRIECSDGQFQYNGRRECSDGQLENRRNNQYGRKSII